MKYRVRVYWARGISAWQGKLDDRDVVFSIDVPWLWLARWLANAHLGNKGTLAYVIHDSAGVVEESPA